MPASSAKDLDDIVRLIAIFRGGQFINVPIPRRDAHANIQAWIDFKLNKLEPFLRTGDDEFGGKAFAYDLPEVAAMYYLDEGQLTSEKLLESQIRLAKAVEKQVSDGESWRGDEE